MKRTVAAGIAAAIAVVLVGGAFGVQYLVSPKTFDECMLAEMRGQAQAMYSIARTECERRHGVEVEIYADADDFSWTNEGPYTVVKLSSEILASYTPSRGQFAFSTKPCSDVTADDMEKHIPSRPENGGFRLGIMAPSDPRCLQLLELYGTRR
ncbi:hypothetical protein [Devosia nitrariae]|uniref:Uncharacterized protein n=1 Tax=Devosia nitrariae TaxID=2071872 RepID=A0ABQ5W1F7_9HYPH|nr:hypothetical protein [Devosia nitrariae]GLQ53636.1 hypothetical protein GCM10010862_08950 [Devosia nitrariae]